MELDKTNPGALATLRENGLDPTDAAYLLANVIPRIVTTEINPMAGKATLQGGILDLIERMRAALPAKAEWLEARQQPTSTAGAQGVEDPLSGKDQPGGATAAAVARIPREVPALPKGHVPRKAILDGIKRSLFALSGDRGAGLEGATLLVQGMGGSGKTVT